MCRMTCQMRQARPESLAAMRIRYHLTLGVLGGMARIARFLQLKGRQFSVPPRGWLWEMWWVLIWVITVGIASGCSSRNEGRTEPRLLVKDFGRILVGSHEEKTTYTYTVSNPSRTESMVLRLVRKSCSCFQVTPKRDLIAPGEDGRVTFVITPSSFAWNPDLDGRI